MQTAVERVIRSFTARQPMQHASSGAMNQATQDHGTQLATRLLENYCVQLTERGLITDSCPRA